MAKNISFAMTVEQVKNKTKTVTRRKGWKTLRRGDVLNAVLKVMGLKPGETIQRICQIRVVDVREERLAKMYENKRYGDAEAAKEGFPEMTGREFVAMFCKELGGHRYQKVTRIEFEYIENEDRKNYE